MNIATAAAAPEVVLAEAAMPANVGGSAVDRREIKRSDISDTKDGKGKSKD